MKQPMATIRARHATFPDEGFAMKKAAPEEPAVHAKQGMGEGRILKVFSGRAMKKGCAR